MTAPDQPLLLAGAVSAALWLALAVLVMRGNRRMRRLATLAAPAPAAWPRVAIVFAARDEAATLGAAVPTMLALDYPDLEVIAVDDRSTDGTGALLTALAAREPRLQVEHVRELPAGWIGKNHALHRGAALAAAPWILFTDADIHFAPGALRRAIAHAEAHRLDLLAAIPRLDTAAAWPLAAAINAFSFLACAGVRPWRIPDPRSATHGSVGAFGLVRAATYRALGGHERIRFRPDDDVKLGKLFKLAGARCELLHGTGALSVAWYATLGDMVRGLTKNAFAGADYRAHLTVPAAFIQTAAALWPFAALFLATGAAWSLHALAALAILALGVDQTRFAGGRRWPGLLLPFGLAVFSYILLRSTAVTLWQGGIVWRGTKYPLRELRANRVTAAR